MAIHSNICASKIPWAEEPGGLQSMQSQTWLSTWAYTDTHLWYKYRYTALYSLLTQSHCFEETLTTWRWHVFSLWQLQLDPFITSTLRFIGKWASRSFNYPGFRFLRWGLRHTGAEIKHLWCNLSEIFTDTEYGVPVWLIDKAYSLA